jgi:hypothetical protein
VTAADEVLAARSWANPGTRAAAAVLAVTARARLLSRLGARSTTRGFTGRARGVANEAAGASAVV